MIRMGLKGIVIAVLMLVIWVGLLLVGSVVSERQQFRNDAVQSIAESYAGSQTLVGPVLGSLMLFAVLAAVMIVTRKVDWYRGGAELAKAAVAPPPQPMRGLGL